MYKGKREKERERQREREREREGREEESNVQSMQSETQRAKSGAGVSTGRRENDERFCQPKTVDCQLFSAGGTTDKLPVVVTTGSLQPNQIEARKGRHSRSKYAGLSGLVFRAELVRGLAAPAVCLTARRA